TLRVMLPPWVERVSTELFCGGRQPWAQADRPAPGAAFREVVFTGCLRAGPHPCRPNECRTIEVTGVSTLVMARRSRLVTGSADFFAEGGHAERGQVVARFEPARVAEMILLVPGREWRWARILEVVWRSSYTFLQGAKT